MRFVFWGFLESLMAVLRNQTQHRVKVLGLLAKVLGECRDQREVQLHLEMPCHVTEWRQLIDPHLL